MNRNQIETYDHNEQQIPIDICSWRKYPVELKNVLEARSQFYSKLAVDITFSAQVSTMGRQLVDALTHKGMVLTCGNGGSAAEAQHLVGELVGHFLTKRKGLSAISLNADTSVMTAIGNDFSYGEIFARQLEAVATPHSVLVVLSTSGNSMNLVQAVGSASVLGVQTIGLLGRDGGRLAQLCDHNVIVPSFDTQEIQEVHLSVIHWVCGVIDDAFSEVE